MDYNRKFAGKYIVEELMGAGKSIRIFLKDGSVSGIRHAEIVNWTGQAVSSPRSKIKTLSSWDESKKPGIYFLFGVDEATGENAVYIGEAENVLKRLQDHLSKKDFWNEVVLFTSKDENLTKSHIKYLESRLIELSKIADRYIILNEIAPRRPALPRGDRDAMDEFILNLKILLGVVGYKLLENLVPLSLENETFITKSGVDDALNLTFKVKGIEAKAKFINEGIVVLAGSKLVNEVVNSCPNGFKKLRKQLFENEVIKESTGCYIFTRNHLFKSPSQAAGVISGSSINGRICWLTANGKTLKLYEES